jgi:hypothetical protein
LLSISLSSISQNFSFLASVFVCSAHKGSGESTAMTLGDVTKANNKSTINRNTGGVGGEEQEKAEGEEIIGEMNTAENEREREKKNKSK